MKITKTLSLVLLVLLALSANAFAKDTLTVYSYESFTSEWSAGPKLEKAFEESCNCDVKFVPFTDGITMFNRLRLEGDKPKADLIIGLDNNLEFLLKPESQKMITLSNIMLPVIKTEIEPRFDALTPEKTLAVPQPEKAVSKARLGVWQMASSD